MRRLGALAAALALTATTVACTGPDDEPDTEAAPPSSVVLQPGRPGEDSTTIAPEDYEPTVTGSTHNQADVDFFADMIHHHLQALEMSELAPDRAQDPAVLALADRIHDVQAAEIHGLAAWLQERDLPVPVEFEQGDGSGPRVPDGATDHDHHAETMPGMLTDAQMAELAAASGAEFDRLYLEGMIQHHEGAVDMSVTVIDEGTDERANELATDIGAGQQAEIGRMQDLLADL
ncbi:DUF305 domain-containing protein [Isoptericola jiangsuensis]|uniref:DUF305 domain-containing protein n=1 Tax=Isoptericola jiangsuensis TaxID=548579 RepID=UPI0014737532|nr:DUF305 domain-containing protein [Isoptericola jiangsuensis]